MADAAVARREARRRKILENSHNRLQLISGKNGGDANKDFAISASLVIDKVCESEIVKDSGYPIRRPISNGILNTETSPFQFSQTIEENVIEDEELTSDLTSLLSSTSDTSQTQPLLEKIVNCKYDVVLISLFVQILYYFSVIRFDSSYFFLPLLLYVITKGYWYPKQNNFAFANALLILNGISARRVQKIISLAQWVSALFQDVCVFLFTTILIHAFCLFIKNSVI